MLLDPGGAEPRLPCSLAADPQFQDTQEPLDADPPLTEFMPLFRDPWDPVLLELLELLDPVLLEPATMFLDPLEPATLFLDPLEPVTLFLDTLEPVTPFPEPLE